MNTIEQALADTKCAATSAVSAASKGRVRRVLTSMILLLLVLQSTMSQVGLVIAQQPPLLAPSLTSTPPSASEEVWPTNGWPTATPAEMGMDETKLKQARDFAVSQGRGSGFITRGGKLVMSWGSSSQRYDLKSTTKSIGISALGLAIKDGLMNLSDQAQQHHASIGVPPNSNSATGWLDDITILHLSTQTAGFDKDGGYTALQFQPGTKWLYSDGGPNWLAEAITLKYGQDLNTVMFQGVFTPLGIDSGDLTWRSNIYRDDTLNGIKRREFGSGISANVDAMARIGYLYLRNGEWNGQQIIPQSFVEAASNTVPSVVGLPSHDPDQSFNAPNHYGLLWWNNADGKLANVPRDAFWSWGLFESFILVIPSQDIVVSRAGTEGWQNGFAADYKVL
jgi:CubicO group peptidase (beta-lactamase class C family)